MTSDGMDRIVAAIDGAQDISDPLEGLVDRAALDAGAAFTPEILERLTTLKKDDPAAFEVLRSNLKKAGCRVTALDEAIAAASGSVTGGGRPKQADILIELAQSAELFHTAGGIGFADLHIDGHRRHGRSAPRASAAGSRAASSKAPAARRTPRRCNRP